MVQAGESTHDFRQEKRNPFENHPQLCPDLSKSMYDPTGRFILLRNPTVRILDEIKQFDFGNLTARVLGVAHKTHRLVEHQNRLAAAGEEVGRSNVRLMLESDDLHLELACKDEIIRQMKESHETKLWKVKEEEAAMVSKELLSGCKLRIDAVVKSMVEARNADRAKLGKLKARVKAARRSVKDLREERHS